MIKRTLNCTPNQDSCQVSKQRLCKSLFDVRKKRMRSFRFILIIGMVFTIWHLSSSLAWGIWDIQTVDSWDSVGEYTSLALDSKNYPHISYYDETHGYLKYVWYDGESWDIRTVDYDPYGGDVGEYTSLALDSFGYPHISYLDHGNGNHLKYAWYDGTGWHSQTVDNSPSVGQYTSLALDSSGYPHISYYDEKNRYLKYRWYHGTTLYHQDVDYSGDVGECTSLALDSSGYPHISYYDATNSGLKYAFWNGTSWDREVVDYSGNVGHWTSLALDSSGYPHISYYDATNGDLKYAWYDGTGWHSQTVDSAGDVGEFTSLALDSSGYPHISYYEVSRRSLKYAWYDGTGWHIQGVDHTSGGDVGAWTSLALDSKGYPHISYYDETHGDLKYAWWVPMEVGQATVDHNWKTVNLTKFFINPIVIAKPLSYNDSDPATVRIKLIGHSSFKMRVQEWNYLDGSHAPEKVSYLVVEKGSGMVDGRRWEAGALFTDRCGTSSFESVNFTSSFRMAPVILSSVVTFNGEDTVVTRIKDVTKTGFKVTMQEQEANVQSHPSGEWINWIAWEPGTGTIEGINYQVGITANSVTHNPYEISTNFGSRFVWVDEETSLDAETSHLPSFAGGEAVGWIAFSDSDSSFNFLADMQTTNDSDTANLRYTSRRPFAVESLEVFPWQNILKKTMAKYEKFKKEIKDMTIIQEMKMVLPEGEMGSSEVKRFYKGEKFRCEITMQMPGMPKEMGGMSTIGIYDGKDTWMISLMGKKKLSDEESKQYQKEGIWCYQRMFGKAKIVGTEKIGKRECYVVKPKEEGESLFTKVWLDKKNLVIVKTESKGSEGEIILMVGSDFRKVGDWEMPYKTEMYGNNKLMFTTLVKSVEINKGLSDDLFDPNKAKIKGFNMQEMMKKMMQQEEKE